MKKVYIFNNWHNGDIITNRCLVKALLNYDLDIALGSYRNRHYLVSDLPVKHVISPHDENTPHSPCLGPLCPEGYVPCNSWGGTFRDIDVQHYHNWANLVKTWNRHSEQNGIGVFLSFKEVPMIDFGHPCRVRPRGRAVYVENGGVRSGHCNFNFNMHLLGSSFPDFNFYCTANPNCSLPNVINCENRNLVEMSFISNGCEAIVGKGSGPFFCTYTEANRAKPRAVVNYHSHPFWHYRDNPLRNLNGEGELLGFLAEVYNNPWETL